GSPLLTQHVRRLLLITRGLFQRLSQDAALELTHGLLEVEPVVRYRDRRPGRGRRHRESGFAGWEWKVLRAKRLPFSTQRDGRFERVFELSHVSRPGKLAKTPERRRGHLLHWDLLQAADFLHQMMGQRRDIGLPLAQR